MQFTYNFYAAIEDLRQERYAAAMTKFLMCEELDSTDGKNQEYLGIMYDALRQPDQALLHFRKAYEGAPDLLWERYTAILMKGNEDQKAEAVRILEGVVKRDPKNSEAWEVLKQAYWNTTAFQKSLKAQLKIDELRGYDAYSAIHQYRCYVVMNKPKKAITAIDRYLEQDPTNMQFLLFKVELMEVTHSRWKDLQAMYERILALDAQNVTILNNYAYGLCLNKGDLKQAERMSANVIRQEPENPTYLDTYAWVLHLQGQDALAAFYIKKALDRSSDKDRTVIEEHYRAICPDIPLAEKEPDWTRIRAYGQARVEIGEQVLEARCISKLTRDSAMSISLLAMGTIEVIRIEATPKQIRIINKAQGEQQTLSWKEAARWIRPKPSWEELCRIGGQGYCETGQAEYTLTYQLPGTEAIVRITYDKLKKE